MRYYIEMIGSYEEEHWFDFPTYEAAFNYLIKHIMKDISIEKLKTKDIPEYMTDTVYAVTYKSGDKYDTSEDYYIIKKEDNEIVNIYGGG